MAAANDRAGGCRRMLPCERSSALAAGSLWCARALAQAMMRMPSTGCACSAEVLALQACSCECSPVYTSVREVLIACDYWLEMLSLVVTWGLGLWHISVCMGSIT